MSPPRAQLRDFLVARFQTQGTLRRFTKDHFEDVLPELRDDSLLDLADTFIGALADRGRIPELWRPLLAEREEYSDEIKRLKAAFVAAAAGGSAGSEPIDFAVLVERLADLLSATEGAKALPWHQWVEDVRAAVDPALPVPPASAYGRAHWLINYTHEVQPLAIGLLRYAETQVGSHELKEQIGVLASDIQDYYGIPSGAIDEVRARIANALCKTALVVRLSGGERDVFAIEAYEFWSRGTEAPEGCHCVDLAPGARHVDLASVDPGPASSPGVIPRPRAVEAIMEHLAGASYAAGVEVVAPSELMMSWDQAPEAWETGKGFTLGLRHTVVLRSMRGFEGRENLQRRTHWKTVCNRRFKTHARDCTEAKGDGLDALREQGRVAVIDACGHGAEQLDLCAEAGLSVVIWLRKGLDDATTALACLKSELPSCKVLEVPERLKAVRTRVSSDRGDPRFRIGLLMDHPLRRRPRQPLHRDG